MDTYNAKQLKDYFNSLDNSSLVSISNNVSDFVKSFIDPSMEFDFGGARKYDNRYDVVYMDDVHQNMVKGYDQFTKDAIYKYVLQFQTLFPNILTNEQIVDRIVKNLKHSIIFDDLSTYDNPGQTGIRTNAYFNQKTRKIVLDKYLSPDMQDSYLFHEFTHAITCFDNETKDMDSEFTTESITSYMQELFEQRFYHRSRQINVYLSNYARQLEAIFGNDLFKEYILKYRDISRLFKDYPVNADRNVIFHNMVRIYDEIRSKVNSKESNQLRTEFANTTYELNMALFLSNYMKNHPNLSDSEKLRKIKKMVTLQKSPNFDIYKMMLDKYIRNKSLINKDYTTRFIYNHNRDDYGRDELLKEKYIKFLASKRYGYTQIYDYKNNPLFPNRDNVLYSYGSEYYNYLKKQHYYNHITRLYYDADINLHGSSYEEVYAPIVSESKSLAKEIGDAVDLNKKSLKEYKRGASSALSFMFKAISPRGNSIYSESGPIPVVYVRENITDAIQQCKGPSTRGLLYLLSKRGINEVYVSSNGVDLADNRDIIYEDFGKTVVCRYKNPMKNYIYNSYSRTPVKIKDIMINGRQK